MKTKYAFLLITLFYFHLSFSQENINSKKEIEKDLKEAGLAFYNFDVGKSLNLSKKALNQSFEIKDDALIAKSYNIIALNFEEFYEINKAIEYYKRALNHINLTSNDTIKLAINNNLGSIYSYRKNDLKQSIPYYLKGLYFAEKIKDSIEITYTQLNIAGAYFAAKRYNDGIDYLNASKHFVKSKGELEAKISMCTLFGSYYSHLNDNDKAELFFNEAVNLGNKNKSGLIESNLADVYKDFSDYYKKNKKFEKALFYFDLYNESKQNIYNSQRLQNAKLAGNQIEIDEYKRQIDKVEGEKESSKKISKSILILSSVLLFILLLLLLSVYKNYKLRDETNKELTESNKQLVIAKDTAEEASRLKTQFVSTISHELRTPLYGVVGITNIILDEHPTLKDSPHLNSLKFSARYLLSLVNDLLQINKIEENKIELEHLIFNISDEIQTIVESLDFIAKKNNNTLVTEIDSTIPEFLLGDKLRLSQIFINLVSNALKFTNNGEVKVVAKLNRIEGTLNYIDFKIIDNGVGIAKGDQEKIFEKFVQIERKESDYQGTGLGLSIVRKLINLFGSEIYIESEEFKGTTFYFTLAFEADEKLKNQLINNIDVDLSTNKNYRILVVEDNKINQIVTKKILEGNNYKCTILEDGYAAINLLENEKFDLVLMDINMPIINGFETSKLIRSKGIQTPIIALTAFDKQEITEQALASGMNDIIIKPFESAKLFQIISNLLTNK